MLLGSQENIMMHSKLNEKSCHQTLILKVTNPNSLLHKEAKTTIAIFGCFGVQVLSCDNKNVNATLSK